jgi:hypothetical protein
MSIIDPDKTDEYIPIPIRESTLGLREASRRIEAKRQHVSDEASSRGSSEFRTGAYAGYTAALLILDDVLTELIPPS